eukprot:TRINITY_DN22795_c0_g2_i1.p1 TRINITY_DN22795_c0_g2~~TRINITY_DN22795_c0_g2_i1.p1  ORF type:complete len:477 (-),score=82.59 TRINITY_DN22795_c0_g2_i1:292-1548(-)
MNSRSEPFFSEDFLILGPMSTECELNHWSFLEIHIPPCCFLSKQFLGSSVELTLAGNIGSLEYNILRHSKDVILVRCSIESSAMIERIALDVVICIEWESKAEIEAKSSSLIRIRKRLDLNVLRGVDRRAPSCNAPLFLSKDEQLQSGEPGKFSMVISDSLEEIFILELHSLRIFRLDCDSGRFEELSQLQREVINFEFPKHFGGKQIAFYNNSLIILDPIKKKLHRLILDDMGRRVYDVLDEKMELGLKQPSSICIREDSLFLVDSGSQILELSLLDKNMTTSKLWKTALANLIALAATSQCMFGLFLPKPVLGAMDDMSLHTACVTAWTWEGIHLYQIGFSGFTQPRDLAVISRGNFVMILDEASNSISLLSTKTGEEFYRMANICEATITSFHVHNSAFYAIDEKGALKKMTRVC